MLLVGKWVVLNLWVDNLCLVSCVDLGMWMGRCCECV